ncbi:MAG: IPT/TIG domain-containing protein, partial [Mycetocola sp.]
MLTAVHLFIPPLDRRENSLRRALQEGFSVRHRSALKKLAVATLVGLSLVVSVPLAAQAATDIGTPTGATENGLSPMGPQESWATPTYAQEIVAPVDNTLTSFGFRISGSDSVVFRGIVYAWDGSTVVGAPLWTGSPRSIAGTGGFEDVTFVTGGVELVAGERYVIGATALLDSSTGYTQWAMVGDSYPGGSVVWSNNGDITARWDGRAGADFAFHASFAGIPTVAAVSPSLALTTGGQSIVITGVNFTGATAVTLGGTPAA